MNTICYFGSYDNQYSRNRILIDGLKKNGVVVLECLSKEGSFVKRYPQLIKQYWSLRDKIDLIIVGFVGQLDMPLAWLLAKLTGKRVVFDMFYSMYDTYVFDRQSAKPGSFRALSYFWIDKVAASLADIVITDTNAHARYFIKTFKLNQKKFKRIFVGGDDTLFKPIKKRKKKKIIIEFHGIFTRLHGAEYFVEAAKILEHKKEIEFWLIGDTKNYFLPLELYKKLRPKNMKYFPALSVTNLAKKIAASDISIGHLGTTEKAKSVITNKMFHALSCRLALIAADTKATWELFKDRENAVFVRSGDAKDLAQKILFLVNNDKLRIKIAINGYELAKDSLTNVKLGQELIKIIKSLHK